MVLISVGATLGWEDTGGRFVGEGVDHVLISVGATLGWEDDTIIYLVRLNLVLISVGATLGWEAPFVCQLQKGVKVEF
tara:strand:+ start:2345 stop:2578 length:234 start_codon:yes stop_codon:yes gene_type:complete